MEFFSKYLHVLWTPCGTFLYFIFVFVLHVSSSCKWIESDSVQSKRFSFSISCTMEREFQWFLTDRDEGQLLYFIAKVLWCIYFVISFSILLPSKEDIMSLYMVSSLLNRNLLSELHLKTNGKGSWIFM